MNEDELYGRDEGEENENEEDYSGEEEEMESVWTEHNLEWLVKKILLYLNLIDPHVARQVC